MTEKFMSMRNLKFLLYEVFDASSLTRYPYYAEYDRKMLDMGASGRGHFEGSGRETA